MSKKTFWTIIIDTLERVQSPLTPSEIWQKAEEFNILDGFSRTGKTPEATIAAKCYTDIHENGTDSELVKASVKPTRFTLRKFEKSATTAIVKESPKTIVKFQERDLHPLLVAYAYSNSHFKARVKTIFHEVSNKKQKGHNKWLHPDLVGVQFPFDDYEQETLEMQKQLTVSSIKLFSFEMKIDLNFSNLRECFFQAVSNSSWANEGYLVALHIDEDAEFRDEMRRLNNAFGIGIIKLDPDNVAESQIVFPSKDTTEIDWDTVNRLCAENSDFRNFLKMISEDCQLKKVKSKYDDVLDEEKMNNHVKEKGIV